MVADQGMVPLQANTGRAGWDSRFPANDISPCFFTIPAASGFRIGLVWSPTSWRLSLVMPRRKRFVSEVGPEAREGL